jgi:hypothetical protein
MLASCENLRTAMKSENVPMAKEMPSVRDVTKMLEKEIVINFKKYK